MTETVKLKEEEGIARSCSIGRSLQRIRKETVVLLAKTLTRLATDDSVSAVVISVKERPSVPG